MSLIYIIFLSNLYAWMIWPDFLKKCSFEIWIFFYPFFSFVLQVPVVVDDNGCNGNEDINFRFTGLVIYMSILCLSESYACAYSIFENYLLKFVLCRFTLSGRVVGAVGGESCLAKNEGPSNVEVELLSPAGDLVSSVLTSSSGSYLFTNIIPGRKAPILLLQRTYVCFPPFHVATHLVALLRQLPNTNSYPRLMNIRFIIFD